MTLLRLFLSMWVIVALAYLAAVVAILVLLYFILRFLFA